MMPPIGSPRIETHPKMGVILSRLETLARADSNKIIPIGAAINCLAQIKYHKTFDTNHSTVTSLKYKITPVSGYKNHLGFYAIVHAAAGKQEAVHAAQLILTNPLPTVTFQAFGNYLRYQASKITQSQAVLYALQFHAIHFSGRSACVNFRHRQADGDNFGGFGIAIVQHLVGEQVSYHIVDSGIEDAPRINQLMRHADKRQPYQTDELTEILEKIEGLVTTRQWGEKELTAWEALGGTNHPDWKNRGVAHPPTFNWSASLIDLDKSKLAPFDEESDIIRSFSTLSLNSPNQEENHLWDVDFEDWPSSLRNLAKKSTKTAGAAFHVLQNILECADPLVLQLAALYALKKQGITTGKHKVVTTHNSLTSNCGLYAMALCSLFISDPQAEPETTINPGSFTDEIARVLDAAEADLCKIADSAKAKFFLFGSENRPMQADAFYTGHEFVLLQFLDPNNNIRYLYLDSYMDQRQLLERLSIRNPDDPSWGREELNQFISTLSRLDKAEIWNEEFACYFNEAFGAFHPELLGKRFPNTQQGLYLLTRVYPVDMNEVPKRCPDYSVVKEAEILPIDEFAKRRTKLFPTAGNIAWWTEGLPVHVNF